MTGIVFALSKKNKVQGRVRYSNCPEGEKAEGGQKEKKQREATRF